MTAFLGGLAGAVTLGGAGYLIGRAFDPRSGVNIDSVRPQVDLLLNRMTEYLPQRYLQLTNVF